MADDKKIVNSVVELSVDPNNTTAFLSFTKPENGGADMTYEKIMAALEAKHISFGIMENDLLEAVEKKRYNENICAARWQPPVDGQDGAVTYLFKTNAVIAPTEDEKGFVDYKNLGIVNNITKGTTIATITLPTEGEPGRNILGAAVPQRRGVPARVSAANGTQLVNNGTELIAARNGNLRFVNGSFNVEEDLIITEDVGVSTGNIDFIGNVTVRGNVLEGYRVSSKKNITVNGSAIGAELCADGDIILRTGCINSTITCKGSVRAGFFESSRITCGHDVEGGSFVGGEVFASGNINATGKGIMVGGKYTALENIVAGTIGSENYTRTLISLGNNAVLSEERDALERSIAEMEDKADQLGKILAMLNEQSKKAKLPPEREQMKTEALRSRLKLQAQVRSSKTRIEQINESLMVAQQLTVSVRKAFYPGVTLRINNCIKQVNEVNSHCRATIEDGDIVFKLL